MDDEINEINVQILPIDGVNNFDIEKESRKKNKLNKKPYDTKTTNLSDFIIEPRILSLN